MKPELKFDWSYPQPLLGIDEVGTGAIAGPFVVAGVVFRNKAMAQALLDAGLNDSKKLKPSTRSRLYKTITESDTWWWTASISPDVIHDLGHAKALKMGIDHIIQNFLENWGNKGTILLDGDQSHWRIVKAVVRGDQQSPAIAAASVMAKVTRDAFMQSMDTRHPGYGFGRHMGYVTAEHKAALEKLGACEIHRVDTSPVRRVLGRGISQTA